MPRILNARIAVVLATAVLIGAGFAAGQDSLPSAEPPAAPANSAAPPARPAIYDEGADAAQAIDAALQRAAAENTRVLIQWGANWCGWCHRLHELFATNPDIARKLLYEYEIVLVDVGRMNKNLELAVKYSADFKASGIPYLTILDSSGNVVINHETGSLELPADPQGNVKPGHDAAKVLEFLTQHQAICPDAHSILERGLRSATSEGKPILLHFGAPWCGWRRRFEAWMARPDVQPVLEQHLVLVKIDVDRNAGGKAMMDQYTKGARTGIPWFAFLDAKSSVIATSQGPSGNIGCPHSREEVEAFGALLRQAAPGMTDDQLTLILSSLGDRDAKPGESDAQPGGAH